MKRFELYERMDGFKTLEVYDDCLSKEKLIKLRSATMDFLERCLFWYKEELFIKNFDLINDGWAHEFSINVSLTNPEVIYGLKRVPMNFNKFCKEAKFTVLTDRLNDQIKSYNDKLKYLNEEVVDPDYEVK